MSESDIAVSVRASGALAAKPIDNKPVYLVVVEQGLRTKELTHFVTSKVDKQAQFVEFIGVQFSPKNADEAAQALETGRKQQTCFPWHRVHEIRNLSYKTK